MKKFLSLVLVFVMTISLFNGVTVSAATVIDSGKCGDNVTWTLNSDGVLTISGTGVMNDYNSGNNRHPWYDYKKNIKSVVVLNGVTTIGDYAFHVCSSLASIVIPDSVTSIGNFSFAACSSLTSIVIPNGVTIIGSNTFAGCTSLTSIKIPDSVTSIGRVVFYGCTSLTSVEISNSVTIISENAFKNCASLTSVIIPDSVTTIDHGAFFCCESLTSIELPDSVTSIGSGAFMYCTSLSSIEIPDGVTTIRNIFYGCSSLTSVVIPNSVTTISSEAFRDCTSLTSIEIPDSVTSIGKVAFTDCTSLTSIEIPDGVTTIENSTFSGCTSLASVVIPDSVTDIGNFAFADCTSLTSIVIPNGVTTIGANTFSCCTALTSIEIPDSVTSIGEDAFYGCDLLTDVYYDGFKNQWDSISIGNYNEFLTTANIHFIKDSLTVDKESVFANNTFTLTFTQPKTVVASSLRLDIEFDNEAFEIVEIADMPYTNTQPNITTCNTKGNINILWSDSTGDANTEIAKDTVLLEVTFKVKDTASLGNKLFEISGYKVTGSFNEETFDFDDITPNAGGLTKTIEVVKEPSYLVSGSVKAFGDTEKNVTIELLSGDEVIATTSVTGNSGTYSFEEVKSGTYTVRVSKTKHATREYGITVADADVTQDTEIWLYGDINCDGSASNIDVLQINRRTANLSSAFNNTVNSDYRIKVANITAAVGTDTIINNIDVIQINRMNANLSSVFDRIA